MTGETTTSQNILELVLASHLGENCKSSCGIILKKPDLKKDFPYPRYTALICSQGKTDEITNVLYI